MSNIALTEALRNAALSDATNPTLAKLDPVSRAKASALVALIPNGIRPTPEVLGAYAEITGTPLDSTGTGAANAGTLLPPRARAGLRRWAVKQEIKA